MKKIFYTLFFSLIGIGDLVAEGKSDAEIERINRMLEGGLKLVVAVIFFSWLLSKFRKKKEAPAVVENTSEKENQTESLSMDEMMDRLKSEHDNLNKKDS